MIQTQNRVQVAHLGYNAPRPVTCLLPDTPGGAGLCAFEAANLVYGEVNE